MSKSIAKRSFAWAKRLFLLGISKVSPDRYERFLAHSLLHAEFDALNRVPVFPDRERLWDHAIDGHIGRNTRITYVEFGVFEGQSIRYFAQANQHPQSRFIGLDSFEGLPEGWGGMDKGAFDVGGNLPKVDDSRVTFIKGWFQHSCDVLESVLREQPVDPLVVHYDADLYSSTLFTLSQMDRFKVPYFAIFDEFTGHETRALYNYCQAYGATVEFYGKTLLEGIGSPNQVSCRITPMS